MKKRLAAITMALCVLFSAPVFTASVNAATDINSNDVIIYHTNDSHGYLSGNGESIVGIDTVAGLKESTPDSILVDAGDATQGLPLASLTKGADVIELMNLAGYDIMAAGNHEFDFGTEQFLSNVKLADFSILSANIYRDGAPLLEGKQEENNGCHTIVERNGFKIGFFGITTIDTATSTNPSGIQDLEFKDEIETAKKEIAELEAEGADAIIAVCHLGDGDVSCTSEKLANAMTGEYQDKLDVIIDAHSHTIENKEENGILIVQTGSGMANVGKLSLTIDGDEVTASEELLGPSDLTDVIPKAEVTQRLNEIESSQEVLLGETIGNAETTLWAGQVGVVAVTRLVETNYGDFTADAFRDAAETFLQTVDTSESDLPVVAVENGGGIRSALANGDITKGDLLAAFPYSNTLYMKIVTPQILYNAMEVSGSKLDGQNKETGMLLQTQNLGGFLQISGFTVVYNPDGEEGQKVTSITLDGQTTSLDRNDSITQIMMVSNNYIMNGGSGYTMLGSLPKYGEAGGELETVQSYFESCLENGTLKGYAGIKNRIQMRSEGYEPKDYTASIQIVDESGELLADKELSYRIDGGERKNGITDENGILKVTLTDGAHGIRLFDAQQEIYVDNYAGFGIVEDEFRQLPVLLFVSDGSCDPVEEQSPSDEDSTQSGEEQTDEQKQSSETEQPNQTTDTVSKAEKNENIADVSTPKTGGNGQVGAVALVMLCAFGAIAVTKRSRRFNR